MHWLHIQIILAMVFKFNWIAYTQTAQITLKKKKVNHDFEMYIWIVYE